MTFLLKGKVINNADDFLLKGKITNNTDDLPPGGKVAAKQTDEGYLKKKREHHGREQEEKR